MSENIQNVQIRMREHTIEQMDRIKAISRSPGRSETIRRALEIADMIVNSIVKGEKVIIEASNGKQRQITIMGINS